MQNLSNWRSVRLWETRLEQQLRQTRSLRLHSWAIAGITLGVMWLSTYFQMLSGMTTDSMAVRYLVSLSLGYGTYLFLLRCWAHYLSPHSKKQNDGVADLPLPSGNGSHADPASHIPNTADLPAMHPGGGGDFAGGGAHGDFTGALDAASNTNDAVGEVVSGALEVAANAGEGAVVVVPVVAIFLFVIALVFGAGSLLMLLFGVDVLLAVTVELAFGFVSATTAVSVVREGWLSAAVRLTWKPLLGTVLSAVVLGLVLDFFFPTANSLPEALRILLK